MNERKKYCCIELNFVEPDDTIEAIEELETHLMNNGYDFFTSSNPYFKQDFILVINEEQIGYIDTILNDRNIGYAYL